MEKTGTLNRIQRIILNETATVLILSAFVAFGLFGYLNVYAIVLETALLLLAFIILLASNLNGWFRFSPIYVQAFLYSTMLLVDMVIFLAVSNRAMKYVLLAVVTALLLLVSYIFYKDPDSYDFLKKREHMVKPIYIIVSAAFIVAVSAIAVLVAFEPTDEFLIDLYSAMKFMHGLNPYNPATTAGVFLYFKHFNLDLNVTPTMYGKDITLQGISRTGFPYLHTLCVHRQICKPDNFCYSIYSVHYNI